MAATVALGALGPRLGTAMYFLCHAVASLAYLFILAAPKLQGSEGRRAFLVALAFVAGTEEDANLRCFREGMNGQKISETPFESEIAVELRPEVSP